MKFSSTNYHLINLLFALVIIAIILYSLIFHGTNHPVPALLTDTTGLVPPSKGLSSSFSEIVRGNIAKAYSYNPYGFQIFAFFIIELLMRGLLSVLIIGRWVKIFHLLVIDIFVSVLLFILCFAPMIIYTIQLFTQLF